MMLSGALLVGACLPQGLTPDEQARLDAQLGSIYRGQIATVVGDLTFFLLDNLFVRLVN